MTIEALAQKNVVALDESCDVREAARAMRDRHVGAIVVTQGANRAQASRGRREHDAAPVPATEASQDASHVPLLVSPNLAASWRHMVR